MIDRLNCFTESSGTWAQTVTADAASTNYIDLDAAGLNIAAGRPIYLILKVGTVFATTVSIEVVLQTDSDSAFATTLKEISMWRFLLAQMTAGALLINEAIPVALYQRYLRLYFNVFTNATTGTFIAYLSDAPESAQTDLTLEQAGS
jgi:hypothetical protein